MPVKADPQDALKAKLGDVTRHRDELVTEVHKLNRDKKKIQEAQEAAEKAEAAKAKSDEENKRLKTESARMKADLEAAQLELHGVRNKAERLDTIVDALGG